MGMKQLKFLALILFSGLVAADLPAAVQEDPGQNPLLTVKIPNVEKLIGDIQNLVSEAPGLNASGQMDNIRLMLGGTDWIDTGRSITISVVAENSKTSAIALIPFIHTNDLFRNMYKAQERPDYYLISLPPGQGFTLNPILERKLVEGSTKPVSASLVLEAAAGNILAIAEPLVDASLAKMQDGPQQGTSPVDLSTKELGTIVHEMFAVMKQADILRMGVDITEDSFALLLDVDARPGTDLAVALVDVGGNCRLIDYPIGMPLEYHTRAYNITGTQDLMRSYLETVYGMLGLEMNVDDLLRMSSIFTGEFAAGFDITSTGIALKMAGVLTPGSDGEAFIRESYLPLLESYGRKLSDMAAAESDNPQTLAIERTEDSFVGPVRVMGLKALINSVAGENRGGSKNKMMELRLASLDDLIFIASSDAEIRDLIDGTRNLVPKPASGPTGRLVLDLEKLVGNLKPPVTQGQPGSELPEDLGKIATSFEIKDGKLATRTSVQIELIKKLLSAVASQVPQGGEPRKSENTGNPGSI